MPPLQNSVSGEDFNHLLIELDEEANYIPPLKAYTAGQREALLLTRKMIAAVSATVIDALKKADTTLHYGEKGLTMDEFDAQLVSAINQHAPKQATEDGKYALQFALSGIKDKFNVFLMDQKSTEWKQQIAHSWQGTSQRAMSTGDPENKLAFMLLMHADIQKHRKSKTPTKLTSFYGGINTGYEKVLDELIGERIQMDYGIAEGTPQFALRFKKAKKDQLTQAAAQMGFDPALVTAILNKGQRKTD